MSSVSLAGRCWKRRGLLQATANLERVQREKAEA